MSLSTKRSGFFFLYPLCVCYASPIFFANHAFPGSNVYTAADIPAIDILIMSHDHWDHLDYPTILSLKDKIRKIVCPLGVGEYFEAWRFAPDQLLDLACWKNSSSLPCGIFSGWPRHSSYWHGVELAEATHIHIEIGQDIGHELLVRHSSQSNQVRSQHDNIGSPQLVQNLCISSCCTHLPPLLRLPHGVPLSCTTGIKEERIIRPVADHAAGNDERYWIQCQALPIFFFELQQYIAEASKTNSNLP